ncbi:hypothetical protein EC2853500_3763 [Escherichia coli 2853500]|nr:hypothetical protein EC2853500_3763 [Escherichia coli 2853500]
MKSAQNVQMTLIENDFSTRFSYCRGGLKGFECQSDED